MKRTKNIKLQFFKYQHMLKICQFHSLFESESDDWRNESEIREMHNLCYKLTRAVIEFILLEKKIQVIEYSQIINNHASRAQRRIVVKRRRKIIHVSIINKQINKTINEQLFFPRYVKQIGKGTVETLQSIGHRDGGKGRCISSRG